MCAIGLAGPTGPALLQIGVREIRPDFARGTRPAACSALVALPATASLRSLVRLAHHRWAIEQQYEELKDELGPAGGVRIDPVERDVSPCAHEDDLHP